MYFVVRSSCVDRREVGQQLIATSGFDNTRPVKSVFTSVKRQLKVGNSSAFT